MHARPFEHFLNLAASLTRGQRERLLALLLPAAKLDQVAELIEQTAAQRLSCRHCGSAQLYRHGHAHGLQRYRCQACRRTCNALAGTALARLRHKERWLDYLGTMLDSRSIRRSAAELGVASATSFRWRHRFLNVSKSDRPQCLARIAEADEMYLLESHKGARKLVLKLGVAAPSWCRAARNWRWCWRKTPCCHRQATMRACWCSCWRTAGP